MATRYTDEFRRDAVRIGVVLHRMWRDETEFRFTRDVVTTATGV